MSVVITLKDHQLPHVFYESNGVKRELYVHHDQLLRYIKNSTFEPEEKEEVVLVSPSLPLNTIKYGQKNDDTSILFMVEDEKAHDIMYHHQSFVNVPYPKMVFGFIVRNHHLKSVYVACFKDRFLRDSSELYEFPYSNVYSGMGRLCYYDNHEITDLVQLQTFPYQWISVNNNDHLYYQERTNLSGKALRELFETSQNQSFNYDILKPMHKTFQKWADMILKQ